MPVIRARRFLPVAGQVLAVIACSALGSFVSGSFRFGSPLNLVWVAGLPLLIGCLCNKGLTNRLVASVALTVISLVTVVLLVGPAGLGPD